MWIWNHRTWSQLLEISTLQSYKPPWYNVRFSMGKQTLENYDFSSKLKMWEFHEIYTYIYIHIHIHIHIHIYIYTYVYTYADQCLHCFSSSYCETMWIFQLGEVSNTGWVDLRWVMSICCCGRIDDLAVVAAVAFENGSVKRNCEFSHETWWLFIVFFGKHLPIP